MDPFYDVQKFIEKYSLPCASTPDIEYESALERGIIHLKEELTELEQALANEDYIQACDALADIIWVAIRAALNCGLPIKAIWTAVVRSNMNGKRKVSHVRESKRNDPHDVIKTDEWVPPDHEISDALRTSFEAGQQL